MSQRFRALVVLLAIALAGVLVWFVRLPATITVHTGENVGAAIASAAPGSVIELESGTYRGPVTVDRAITLKGDGATITAPISAEAVIRVAASDVTIAGIAVEGGSAGITVREVEGVTISGVSVTEAEVHGIEVVDAEAHIEDATVSGLLSHLAQGIEIRNSDGRPDSSVTGSSVTGGQEGIVSHVSEVRFEGNEISGTTMRGIVVTEMSDGLVADNRVGDSSGSGLYCGDMSRCHFENNVAADIALGEGGRSTEGWGLVVTYHAAAFEHANVLDGESGVLMTSLGGHIQARSPLDPGTLTDIAAPMLFAVLAAAMMCAIAFGGAKVVVPLLPSRPRNEPSWSVLAFAIVAVVLVQSFHMIEHYLQIYRIHVDHIPSRGGLAGPGVDSEWVHMAYNAVVALLLVQSIWVLRGRVSDKAINFAFGAVIIQSWHVVEHVAKVIGHIETGRKVNEGILGRFGDLAWFHFTINLAVYGMSVLAALLALRFIYQTRAVTGAAPEPAHP